MGCRALTPVWEEMMPVNTGKSDPPICPNTKTNAGFIELTRCLLNYHGIHVPIPEERMLAGKILDATDIPCVRC